MHGSPDDRRRCHGRRVTSQYGNIIVITVDIVSGVDDRSLRTAGLYCSRRINHRANARTRAPRGLSPSTEVDGRLARFISEDTVVLNPGNSMSWDRFAYVNGNPIRYTDPTGHFITKEPDCTQLSCSGDPAHKPKEDDKGESDDTSSMTQYISNGINRAETFFTIGAPTLEPWYFGPLPDEIIQRLDWLGVSNDLTTHTRIMILPFDCSGCTYHGFTLFDWVFIFDVKDYGQNRPNDLLVHELVHVRQYRDEGWAFVIEYLRHRIHAQIRGDNIYYSIPVEIEARECQTAYCNNEYLPLDVDPCNIR
jgi:hypothetical protein